MEQKASDIQKQRIKEIEEKAKHFETNTKSSICFQHEGDSPTLVGEVQIITDMAEMRGLWDENNRAFFPKGINDPR